MINYDNAHVFHKKQVLKKHEVQLRQKLTKIVRNTGRMRFKSKLEKTVLARQFTIKLKTSYKKHPSLKCFKSNIYFSSYNCRIWAVVVRGNFKNFEKTITNPFREDSKFDSYRKSKIASVKSQVEVFSES